MQDTNRFSSFAARTILALLIVIPVVELLTFGTPSLTWLVWAVISLWAMLDAIRITMLAFPDRHSSSIAAVTLLAAINFVASLCMAFFPATSMRSLH